MKANNWENRIGRRNRAYGIWTVLWVLTLAVAVFGPQFFWSSKLLTALAVCGNLGAGLGMIDSFRRWVREIDEMQRRIQLEALAWASGIGIVCGLSFSAMDISNLVPFDAEFGFIVMMMSAAYSTSLVIGRRRLG